MSDLVERVARAIGGCHMLGPSYVATDGSRHAEIPWEGWVDHAHAAIRECWQQIDGMIVRGPQSGNGCDRLAQNNGLILAANALMSAPEPAIDPQVILKEAMAHLGENTVLNAGFRK